MTFVTLNYLQVKLRKALHDKKMGCSVIRTISGTRFVLVIAFLIFIKKMVTIDRVPFKKIRRMLQ